MISIQDSTPNSAPSFGKNALVTGGSRGIGEATAIKLAQDGYNVTLASRSLQKLNEVKSKLPVVQEGQVHYVWQLDLRDISAVSNFEGAPLPASSYDVFFSNAGIVEYSPLVNSSDLTMNDIFTVNLISPMALTKTLVKAALEVLSPKPLHIIYNSSVVAKRGVSEMANYSASKSALDAFMRSLARELGPKGIFVNSVNPGSTETEMTSNLDISKYDEFLPISGWVTPDSVAEAVMFLAKSTNVSGISLTIDNGFSS